MVEKALTKRIVPGIRVCVVLSLSFLVACGRIEFELSSLSNGSKDSQDGSGGATDSGGTIRSINGDSGMAGASGGASNPEKDGENAGMSGSAGDAQVDSDVGVDSDTEVDGDVEVDSDTEVDGEDSDDAGCSATCENPHGTAECIDGTCVVSCTGDYADCDGPANGCETDLSASLENCGYCGNACSVDNGTPICADGTCEIADCDSGYDDCDGLFTNGCETELNTASDCSGCGDTCPDGGEGSVPVCNAGVCSTVCDLSGTFAIKVSVDVTWEQRQWIKEGSGTVFLWSMLQGAHNGNSVTGTLLECGVIGPRVESKTLHGEFYRLTFPNELFDQTTSYLPPGSATSATLGSALPDATFELTRTSLLMGATMTDPLDDPWPSSASGLEDFDTDEDGNPGVSAVYANSAGDIYPPLDSSPLHLHASTTFAANRATYALSGTLTSCTQSAGTADVTHLDLRIFGCVRVEESELCDTTEADILDINVPVYDISAASYTLVRIDDSATCADVRDALP
ncbi:MAG: hypothetical protein JXA30_22305 [Deltaproteobacteria bacterium]|nr:hypothetical protein [Deltaproteobacteria bacterium]